ncbi:MAG: AAA family ATPase, partial [Caldilineaceae bacterium]|nr:AAA family ATPase [Caldilineaceae bacterium]
LKDFAGRRAGLMSGGQQRLMQLELALMSDPDLILIDEPTVGLDPTQIVEIRSLIRRLSEHSTILFSTHILSEVEALCDRAVILMNGEIRADAKLDELAGNNDAILVLDKAVDSAPGTLKTIKGVKTVDRIGSGHGHAIYRVSGEKSTDLCPAIYQIASTNQWPVRELRSDRQTLESVFSQLATKG